MDQYTISGSSTGTTSSSSTRRAASSCASRRPSPHESIAYRAVLSERRHGHNAVDQSPAVNDRIKHPDRRADRVGAGLSIAQPERPPADHDAARARVTQERDDHPFGATVIVRPAVELVPLVPLSGSMLGLSALRCLDDTDDAHGKHESRQKNEELVHVRTGLPMARCLLLSGGASLAARGHPGKSPGGTRKD